MGPGEGQLLGPQGRLPLCSRGGKQTQAFGPLLGRHGPRPQGSFPPDRSPPNGPAPLGTLGTEVPTHGSGVNMAVSLWRPLEPGSLPDLVGAEPWEKKTRSLSSKRSQGQGRKAKGTLKTGLLEATIWTWGLGSPAESLAQLEGGISQGDFLEEVSGTTSSCLWVELRGVTSTDRHGVSFSRGDVTRALGVTSLSQISNR